VRPLPYSASGDIRATLLRMLAYMGGLGLLATLAASFLRTEDVVAAVNPAPRPEWIAIDRPHPAFELQMPEWASATTDYAILRRASGDSRDGGRKDVLRFGDPAASGFYAMIEIDRPGSAGERFLDAPSEIAARILAYPVTDDVKAAGSLDSKFGRVPLVDFAITAGGDGHFDDSHASDSPAHARRCLGFARPFDSPLMQISGWYCSPGDELVDRAMLACALDRLTMLSSGNDADLAALFAHAEVKRNFCGQRSPILAATPEGTLPDPQARNTKLGISFRTLKLRGRLSMR
jgi:hypothetical protein